MKLTNPEFCGLLVWGTKRGLIPFFHFGLDIEESELERLHGDNDIRNHNINPAEPYDRLFYGIDQYSGMVLIHQFRTIIDYVDRPGFFAVTLVMPAGRGLAAGTTLPLLNQLSDKYHQLYVQGSAKPNQIRIGITEDSSLFGEILRLAVNRLISIPSDAVRSVVPKQAFIYSSAAELSAIFDHQGREEIRSVKKLFLFADGMRNLCPREIPLGILPPPPRRTDIELEVMGAGTILTSQTIVQARINGSSAPVTKSASGAFLITGVRAQDQLEIQISCNGYTPRTATPAETRQWLSAHGEHSNQPLQRKIELQKMAPSVDRGFSKPTGSSGQSEHFDFGGASEKSKNAARRKRRQQLQLIGVLLGIAIIVVLLIVINWPGSNTTGNPGTSDPGQEEVQDSVENSSDSTDKIEQKVSKEDSLQAEYEKLNASFNTLTTIAQYRQLGDSIERLKAKLPTPSPLLGKLNALATSVKEKIDALSGKKGTPPKGTPPKGTPPKGTPPKGTPPKEKKVFAE
jgi:hypothetical protein